MKVLITGAGGFIGNALLNRLVKVGHLDGRSIDRITAMDKHFAHAPGGVDTLVGDLADDAVLDAMAGLNPEVCFHLASLPGGASESDPRLSRRVNLDTTLDLFETLERASSGGRRPVVVYASTIAVYGLDLPDPVGPDTPTQPAGSYGAHKLACELLLADATRRGGLDGRSLRLPGIVARPRTPSGLKSAFMSDLLHALAAGEPCDCPVGPEATAWWMSARICAQNLMHAAVMDPGQDTARAWPLPVLRLSIGQVVQTLSDVHGVDGRGLVRYLPQSEMEASFGRFPTLDDRASRALGLRDDGDAEALVRRALGP